MAAHIIVTLALVAISHAAHGQTQEPGCSYGHGGGAGPFDFRSQRQMLNMVERRHFTSKVERLVSGESTTHPGPDIDYTLAKFPNHHRALISLSKLAERMRVGQVTGMDHSVNCYFERALRLWPDDTVARQIYARHLGRSGRKPDAIAHLQTARRHAKDNPLTHHNIGLVALELGDHALALQQAHQAIALGYPGTGLRDALVKGGRWAEPAPQAAASAAEPAASEPVVGKATP